MSAPPPVTGVGPLSPAQLRDWYAVPPEHADGTWVRGSFITTLDGRATGPDGRAGSLNEGSEGDHAVFNHLREWADVVVVGAGTARAEGYTPMAGVPLAVVSRGTLEPESLRRPDGDAGEVVFISGHGTDITAAGVLATLHDHGWRRIVLEGGPHLFGSWLRERLVNELCVTVRPVLTGGDGPLLVPPGVDLGGLLGSPTHLLTWGGDILVRTRLG
ncbi:dihydrofolate reductase family protein [Propionibacteriaceae bacterium G1746]|uniref:dihydrofolate reductase family protein n=1 Tax=Aestuariimicrobium sp. G57 TaxID=3418485 RepID=UPI003C251D25